MTTARETAPRAVHRKDYLPPEFLIDTVDLDFELGEEWTDVRARLAFRRNPDARDGSAPLHLLGEALETVGVALDGTELGTDRLQIEPEGLTVVEPPDSGVLETHVRIRPQDNLELSGLYRSGGTFCTQCEAEGFRRITWFPDRPDVMARFTTTITADKERCPVLLSNGNRVSAEDLQDGRHRVRWEDPFPKPSYLFALVAGELACHPGSFRTRSGRDVRLEIWVEPRNIDKCDHALRSLQRAMKWDEETFGLEYDLDVYMIVAVSDFNMGAMENKGLNIFNSKFVLARPETATDDDFEHVEGVIGHEYFHNWTGNRVTCRDWFQLTLKEGLTVFRDQRFTADMTSHGVKRIADVSALRAHQFPEDAGPLAHPIRPESYIAMDNFYTSTVYEKGAQVIGMYHTLLGAEGFRKGMDLYFERHDGSAVTCDDFRAAMADANGRDLTQFERWYTQAGTPRLSVAFERDGEDLVATFAQQAPVGQGSFEPLHVPVRFALIDPEGAEVPLDGGATETVLEVTEREQSFRFAGVPEGAVPSVLRDFSAPVLLQLRRTRDELAFLFRADTDDFNRWEAGQKLFGDRILEMASAIRGGESPALEDEFVRAFAGVLDDDRLDGSIQALLLRLPSELALAQEMDVIEPDSLHAARELVRRTLSERLHGELLELYRRTRPSGPFSMDRAEVHRRAINGAALAYLAASGTPEGFGLADEHFASADNMTDSQAALGCLVFNGAPSAGRALETFYERWKDDPLVLDKWFSLQAVTPVAGAPARVRELVRHPDFDLRNPNRARSVVHAFAAGNPTGFHDVDGEGYRFVADHVLEIGSFNPQVASRLAKSFNQWRRFDDERQAAMRTELERIARADGLSKDVYEVVTKALEG